MYSVPRNCEEAGLNLHPNIESDLIRGKSTNNGESVFVYFMTLNNTSYLVQMKGLGELHEFVTGSSVSNVSKTITLPNRDL